MTHHAVKITREGLAGWFDAVYEDGEPDGKFSWLSDKGVRCFERLRSKNIVVLRHTQSTYQAKSFGAENIQRNRDYLDAQLTELGKVQAAGLAVRLALGGFRPQLVVSSPLTRCMQTAVLAFPAEFLPGHQADVKVLSQLLPEIVHSWGDTGCPLDEICDKHPQLERFRKAESASRFQHVDCDPSQGSRPRRWELQPAGNPVEQRCNAKRRAALVWRWLSENRPEQNIAIVTHSKMINEGEQVCLLGHGIEDIGNGDFVTVSFEGD